MPDTPIANLNRVRLATLLAPPLGLLLLWRKENLSLGKKILGTAGILFYSLLYAALIVWILMLTTSLEIEWRGGFPPVLTFSKTLPDYDALEADRARHAALALERDAEAHPPPYWTDFRGPNRDGHYTGPILTAWPADGPPRLWHQPIGGGYASFVIARGLAFTIEQRREQEVVTAYDIDTGAEIWAFAYDALFQESMGGDGPRATPAYNEGRVYALGALGHLHCLDAESGALLWRRNILSDARASNLTWAMSASPLVVDDLVVVLPGGTNGRSVLAYDTHSGEVLWGALDDKAAYASPMLATLAGERQILVATARRAAGLKPETGEILWEHPWTVQHDNQIAQPVIVDGNRFVLSAGYGTGCGLIEVTRDGDGFATRMVWRNRNLKNKFTSSVYWEGHIYGLDESILTCIDVETGRRKWKDGRYGYGQVLLADGHLIVLAGNGQLALVRATPERHEELVRFPALNGKTWNHPAIAHGRLFIRNATEMACFDFATE